jgi:very-short-patch-repair endonuclease
MPARPDYAAGFSNLFRVLAPDLPTPTREYRFHPMRRWRFDLAWPDHQVAVEVEGIVPGGGRHQRMAGYAADCEKYRAATLAGWAVLRYATPELRDAPVNAVEEVARFLRKRHHTAAVAGTTTKATPRPVVCASESP